MSSRIAYGFQSLAFTLVLSFIAMGVYIGESCGFSPGMLVVSIFGPMLLGTGYGSGAALLMFLIGAIGQKRGLYVNGGIVILGLALFVFLAIASANGFTPWPSKCTINF